MKKAFACGIMIALLWQNPFAFVAMAKADEDLTPVERKAALNLAASFASQWEQSGDMNKVVQSLYAPDFIERFIAQEKRQITDEESLSKSRIIEPGIRYMPSLLDTVSTEDWKRFYLASHELLFCIMTILLNQKGASLLQGDDVDDEEMARMLERIIPKRMREELANHSILRSFANSEVEDAAPICTIEEMRDASTLLERLTAEIKKERGETAYQHTLAIRRLNQKLSLTSASRPVSEIHEDVFFGVPAGQKIICVPMLTLFHLMLAELDGQYKVLWIHPVGD